MKNTSLKKGVEMPAELIKKRGGAVRFFTKKLPNGKYLTCEVVRKKGKHGGTTICSEPKMKLKG